MSTVDITPSPRILRTLGEIPFSPWQCIAELVDNSIDALLASGAKAGRVSVGWSDEGVSLDRRTVEVADNGPGMSLEALTRAASAGWSGNNPIDHLGLFGMGFNIATARLGECTRICSATADSDEWVGIEIDFARMTAAEEFRAPVFRRPKSAPGEHGTTIEVSRLKSGVAGDLVARHPAIRRQLETVYSPLLSQTDITIELQRKILHPREHCVWGADRWIVRSGERIPAVIEIDYDLGSALFDLQRNAYLTPYEQDVLFRDNPDGLPHIIERSKKLCGWVGIQRYSDPDDFGIDFIRNGRKILMGDKSLFSYVNPVTGRAQLEYPVELGSTVGGRIVGELTVDYLIPTYQKNDFDRSDLSWHETVEALRGIGPILPKHRKSMSFSDSNAAPLALLVNGYRRTEPGTKHLAIESSLARQWAAQCAKGAVEFLDDSRWWKAALDADRQRRGADADVPPVGEESDEVDEFEPYVGAKPSNGGSDGGGKRAVIIHENTEHSEVLNRAIKHEALSKDYRRFLGGPALKASVYELREGVLNRDGARVPVSVFQSGPGVDIIVDTAHPLLQASKLALWEVAALFVAERFKLRDQLRDTATTFLEISDTSFSDQRIDRARLRERAEAVFQLIRGALAEQLDDRWDEVLDCVSESTGDVEQLLESIMGQPDLIEAFSQRSSESLAVVYEVPARTVFRLVDRFASQLMDGKVFRSAYHRLSIPGDELASNRVRAQSKERLLGLIRDVSWMLGEGSPISSRSDLARAALSLSALESELV